MVSRPLPDLAGGRTQPLAWSLSLLVAFLAGAALNGGLTPGGGGAAAAHGVDGASTARFLIEEGGAGLSTGTKVRAATCRA